MSEKRGSASLPMKKRKLDGSSSSSGSASDVKQGGEAEMEDPPPTEIACGYLGPRPNPPSRSNRPKGLKGKRSKHRLAHECRADPPFGYLKGIKPRH